MNKFPKAKNIFLIQTAHKVSIIRRWTDFLLAFNTRHMQPYTTLSRQWWIQALVGSRAGHPVVTLQKKYGMCPVYAALPVHQELSWKRAGLSEDSWLRATGAMCNGRHMVLGIMQTHGWPEARYSTQHYWVRPELPTDNPLPFPLLPSAFQSLFTGQNQLSIPHSCCPANNLLHFSCSCTHRAYGSCAVQPDLLPTHQGVGRGHAFEAKS